MKKLQVMVTDEEFEAIKAQAELAGLSISNYARKALHLVENKTGGSRAGSGSPPKCPICGKCHKTHCIPQD